MITFDPTFKNSAGVVVVVVSYSVSSISLDFSVSLIVSNLVYCLILLPYYADMGT